MRLWSMHPKYLDRQGLTALWREGLGALKSLEGEHVGYHHHPQLERFKALGNGRAILERYLYTVYFESGTRGYTFDGSKVSAFTGLEAMITSIPVTKGQVEYEMKHLWNKMKERSIPQFKKNISADRVILNPIFELIDGDIESWEKIVDNR